MMQRIALLLVLILPSGEAAALKFSGNVAVEELAFTQDARYQEQMDDNLTLSLQPKFSHEWNNRDDLFSMELFYRFDNKDEEREHADIRELKWLHVNGDYEWRIGVDTVFWGVTESQHLVDVINQTDRLEGFDGEDKLGQPMLHFTSIKDWGVFHVFILPGFREASFVSEEGRLRLPLVVDKDQAVYESSDEDAHVDYALRYTQYIGDTEVGLSLFDGTNREPLLTQGLDRNGDPVLIPVYEQVTQFGLDLQSIVENWTWKLELIHRNLDSGSFTAATGGFEYTFYGILDSAVDLGTLLEYSGDDRDEDTAGVFDNDLFGGLRFAFNDVQSTEILAGMLVDIDKHSRTLRVEASRRMGDSWKLNGEFQLFSDIDVEDPLYAFADDDYLKLELAWYF
jgi:hypothetical protein